MGVVVVGYVRVSCLLVLLVGIRRWLFIDMTTSALDISATVLVSELGDHDRTLFAAPSSPHTCTGRRQAASVSDDDLEMSFPTLHLKAPDESYAGSLIDLLSEDDVGIILNHLASHALSFVLSCKHIRRCQANAKIVLRTSLRSVAASMKLLMWAVEACAPNKPSLR